MCTATFIVHVLLVDLVNRFHSSKVGSNIASYVHKDCVSVLLPFYAGVV